MVENDDFLSKFNVSISTDNFIAQLLEFSNFYGYMSGDKGNWTNKHHINYTEVISQKGLCYTFNFPTAEKFFNLDAVSSDFNYNKTKSVVFEETEPFFDYPLSTSSSELGMFASVRTDHHSLVNHFKTKVVFVPMNSVENGIHLTFHDPYEIISKDSPNHFAMYNQSTLFKINPTKVNYDDSIAVYSPEE